MKQVLHRAAAVVTCLALSFAASATVWTVSNNPNRPAQFTGIQAAINAASPNDTILITGGTYSGALSTVIPLVFYGEAISATAQFPVTTISSAITFGRLNSSLSASGSRVYGVRFASSVSIDGSFAGYLAGQRTMTDFIFERCEFANALYLASYDGLSNVTVRNCLFKSANIYLNYWPVNCATCTSGIIFTNNVFDNTAINGYFASSDFNGGVLFRNNVFVNRATATFDGNVWDIILENNIFYKAEPTGAQFCTFNNNITYLNNSNTLPYGNNLGSGNIINVNPLFTNYPALGGAHTYTQDFTLQGGSPGIGTGTNGADIGLNGGNAPVANIPIWAKIPGVTELNIPVSSVPVGGTLQIEIQAVSRD